MIRCLYELGLYGLGVIFDNGSLAAGVIIEAVGEAAMIKINLWSIMGCENPRRSRDAIKRFV
jgi:hypothetical protein